MTNNDAGEGVYDADDNNDMQNSLLETVFGTRVNLKGITEDAVVRALEFKVEQERTKQQFYRLENIAKSIELFKLASEMGVPAHHIASIFANENNSSPPLREQLQQRLHGLENTQQRESQFGDSSSQNRPPVSYRFPPAGSNLPPKPMSFPSTGVTRARSPARIGANAVAVLNENVVLKEENDAHVTPCRKNDEYDNDYDSSNDNSHHSHSSHSSNNEPENDANIVNVNASSHANAGSNKVFHQRNFSVPNSKYSSQQIPIGITPIINLNKNEKPNQRQKQDHQQQSQPHSQQQGSNGSGKKLGMVGKKHRRTKSGSSFGVIDLNILEASKQQESPKSNLQQLQSQQNASQQQPQQLSAATRSQNPNSYDEKTCSESSSRNPSPVRNTKEANSVSKLLNNS